MNCMSIMKRKVCSTDGFVLYTTLAVLGITFFVVVGVSAIFLREIQVAGETSNSVIALLAAESGMERALYEMQVEKLHSGCPNLIKCTIGRPGNPKSLSNGSQYYVTILASGVKWCQPHGTETIHHCIRSVGIYHTSSRALEVRL